MAKNLQNMYLKPATLFFCLLLLASPVLSQESTISAEDMATYKVDAEQLVSYLEGTLNFLGDPNEVIAEKDIIFNESYLKIFQDAETQVEDDLDDKRKTPLNKDVQAYLKDVMFFYKKVTFSFHINSIDQLINQNGQVFFKVTTNRNLQGIMVNGDTVNNNLVRYFEMNLNQQKKDLKIVSMYTTKLNEREEMRHWWNNMSTAWKQTFGRSVLVYDTLPFMNILSFTDSALVTIKWVKKPTDDTLKVPSDSFEGFEDSTYYKTTPNLPVYEQVPDTIQVDVSTLYRILRAFRSQKSIDISHNHLIRNLEPLSELTDLVDLNMSFTLIGDLTPIRNLNKLENLNMEGSAVSSLDAIRYLSALKELNLANNQVSSLEVLQYLPSLIELDLTGIPFGESDPLSFLSNLKHLNLKNTRPYDFHGISGLTALSDLNLSTSSIKDLRDLATLTNLKSLNIDSTEVNNLVPISTLTGLSVLQANSTQINSLEALMNIPDLKTVYCDNSGITMEKATAFMDKKPGCLVIYNSQNLVNWWSLLDDSWKKIFIRTYQLTEPLTKEQLHLLIDQQEISLAHNQEIQNIEPLSMLHRLEKVDLSHTSITDLSPLSGLNNLEMLNLSTTPVESLESLSGLQNLMEVDITKTAIGNLMPLVNNQDLSKIYCDNSQVNQEQVFDFRQVIRGCVVIFQTEYLSIWWNQLSPEWKSAFYRQLKVSEKPSAIELQQLANLISFEESNNPELNEISPLNVLVWLEKLTLINTGVSNLSPVADLKMLVELQIPQNPITDISMLSKLQTLEVLNLENTPIDDIEPLSKLIHLKKLNISGTRVRNLKYLSQLVTLEDLSINNTKIKNLNPLEGLTNIKSFKCYNTSLKKSKVDEFTRQHPGAEVVYY
ncbi:MAG: leucine-rich repeat domain-containing protein [Bacteroidales bacterium]|nr:leucine-rich repeat domain-containing protein [Bacteroidales bacterium]